MPRFFAIVFNSDVVKDYTSGAIPWHNGMIAIAL
jgi:hypothetical protein